jgi:hypothetical protein
LRGGELPRFGVGGGEEGHVVGAEQRIFVGIAAEQDFADLRLAALHRALDLVGLVQRTAGMDGDLELAGRGLVHVGGELVDVLGMEIGGRVGVGMSHLVWADAARAVKPSAATSVRRQVFISGIPHEMVGQKW